MKEEMKKTARLAIESSAFDARALLGLDRLGLIPVSQRHEKTGSRAGVWLIGCEPEDDTARHCARCGVPGRVYFVKSAFRFSSLIFFGFRRRACRRWLVGLLAGVGFAEHEGLADAPAWTGELDEASVVDDAVD